MDSYDAIADLYDDDMGRNNPGHDIAFYREYARRAAGRVLELGCGTGRITIPLVKDGCEVVAIDSSARMLQAFKAKAARALSSQEQQRLIVKQADMRHFVAEEPFSLILCPFCAFTYITRTDDQVAFLKNIRSHLRDDGLFIVDSFVPKHEILAHDGAAEWRDYERVRSDGTLMKRRKVITQNRTTQINEVTRIYELYDAAGALIRTVRMEDRIRYMFKGELEYFLRYQGFDIVEIFGDYDHSPYSYEAQKMVFVLSKSARA